MELSMSHSLSDPQRGWDFGLYDNEYIAFVHCVRTGLGPLDWLANDAVQYVLVEHMRQAWAANQVKTERPKGAQEGFEIRVTWPAALASAPGVVERVDAGSIQYRRSDDNRRLSVRLNRQGTSLTPLVHLGDSVFASQILASVVPVSRDCVCPSGADVQTYVALASSVSLSDRYTAVKALGYFDDEAAQTTLVTRTTDPKEHIYVRVDAAAGLMRRGNAVGRQFLTATLRDEYLANRLESAIVLGEVATPEAAQLLIATVEDQEQDPEIRAGAAWSLGELGAKEALPTLVRCFDSLQTIVKVEAARALAKLARLHLSDVVQALPAGSPEQRPGIAWALSKAGQFTLDQMLPVMVDDDSRQWVTYIIGTQQREALLPGIAQLADQDPEVYFAVTMLWKIFDSWVYGLEEY